MQQGFKILLQCAYIQKLMWKYYARRCGRFQMWHKIKNILKSRFAIICKISNLKTLNPVQTLKKTFYFIQTSLRSREMLWKVQDTWTSHRGPKVSQNQIYEYSNFLEIWRDYQIAACFHIIKITCALLQILLNEF